MGRVLSGRYASGFTRTVLTAWGKETYQVLLEEVSGRWIARIVTLPSRIWVEPGGREAVKFFGATAEQAEKAAANFIEEERVATGRRAWMPRSQTPEAKNVPIVVPAAPKVALRIAQRYLVRFGVARPENPGVTANLSETGLFIITDRPGPIGSGMEIDLRFPDVPVMLGGEVVWVRTQRHEGESLGCGIRLVKRPLDYLAKVRGLLEPHHSE